MIEAGWGGMKILKDVKWYNVMGTSKDEKPRLTERPARMKSWIAFYENQLGWRLYPEKNDQTCSGCGCRHSHKDQTGVKKYRLRGLHVTIHGHPGVWIIPGCAKCNGIRWRLEEDDWVMHRNQQAGVMQKDTWAVKLYDAKV